METKKIDPWLLLTIADTTGFPNTPYDLTKVKALVKWHDRWDQALWLWKDGSGVRDWLEIQAGAFGLLGEMPNLHTLTLPFGGTHQNIDYSFLANCRKLKKLDVGDTDFRDCSLLAGLPALRYVRLPCKDQLIHTEVLDQLKAKMEFTGYLAAAHPPVPWGMPGSGAKQPVQSAPQVSPRQKPYQGSIPIEALLEDIRVRTKAHAYRLRVRRGAVPGLTDSKIGGLPYWDLSLPYPTDGSGQPMQLLAQINFAVEDMDKPFPGAGLLQFFIGQDEMFGCNFACAPDQKNYRVVYHPQVDGNVTPEQVSALGAPGLVTDYKVSPLEEELAIYAERADSFANDRSFVFEDAFRAAVKAVMGVDMGEQESSDFLDEDAYDALYESFLETDDGCSNGGHWMLGYPSFTQEDPRSEDSPFDTLLLQIDSMWDEGNSYSILWGDCGVANFFIARTDLEKLDFSRVLYNWDCC